MSRLTVPSTSNHPYSALDTYPDNEDCYEITVRFSASLPDLPLSVPVTSNPTTATVKQLVRSSLSDDLKEKRIRLIHAGKALDDATPLSTSLKRPGSRPPSRIATPGPYASNANPNTEPDNDTNKGKAKGKLAVRNPPAARIYIHCSIGDIALSPEDLAAETVLATTKAAQSQEHNSSTRPSTQDTHSNDGSNTTLAPPQGFDRLLTAGFTASEVTTLRLQFMSIQSHTHTPDTMPSPTTLRAMEDQWLDNSNAGTLNLDAAAGDGSAGPSGVGMGEDDGNRGALEDMIWGTTVGFFWPVGCLIWGVREEGIFSPRRKIAIVIGVLLNLGLGFVRWGG